MCRAISIRSDLVQPGIIFINVLFPLFYNKLLLLKYFFHVLTFIENNLKIFSTNSGFERCVLDQFSSWLQTVHQITLPYDFRMASNFNKKKSLEYLLYQFLIHDPIGKQYKSFVFFDGVPTGAADDMIKIYGIVAMFYSNERNYEGMCFCIFFKMISSK